MEGGVEEAPVPVMSAEPLKEVPLMLRVVARTVAAPAVREAAVPEMLVPTSAEGVPSAGVTRVGEVPRTTSPVPVQVKSEEVAIDAASPVEPVMFPRMELADTWAKLANGRSPVTPVESGRPVALVRTRDDGVPYALEPEKMLVPVKELLLARSVEEAAVTVMSAEPLKEVPLMLRAVARMVAAPAVRDRKSAG